MAQDIRNIAIIAHVDHGKTTLVDALLRQSGIFRENQEVAERVMDSGDIERERGITILSKNTAVSYQGTKINIIDTPGHADFGGEVERVLKMVQGVVLLVDAYEGPMPQTKFVLKKAFDLDLAVVVCINKMDRDGARPDEVVGEVLDLFIELGADDSVLDAPFVYASAKEGAASLDPEDLGQSMAPLFETIVENIPAPEAVLDAPWQVLISTIDYNDYVGRIGIGRLDQGVLKAGAQGHLINALDPDKDIPVKVSNIFVFEGLDRVQVDEAQAGNIIAISGIEDINIGDSLAHPDIEEGLDFVKISEPTLAMTFSVNDSPFAGREGDFLTSRQIKSRLMREVKTDVSLRVEETGKTDAFKVSGRGELHLSVLIERMRREGYEFQVSKPEVLYKEIDGKRQEPMEKVTIDVDPAYMGVVIEKMGQRKGDLISMEEPSGGYTRLVFNIPARGLIGYRQVFMTDTRGSGIMNSEFAGYAPYKGDIPSRPSGSIISFDTGTSSTYGLHHAQERGTLFIGPGQEVYEGQVVGLNPAGLDIEVSVTRTKKHSNVRQKKSDDALVLSPVRDMSLEEALDFIEEDELIEVTPSSLRIRKEVLKASLRHKRRKD